MLRVTLDGTAHAMEDGLTVLDALRRAGIEVPHLCHDDRLVPVGACRLCLVELEGRATPVASCTTPLLDGMTVNSRTPALESERRTLLQLLADRHPAESLEGRDDPFAHALRRYGIEGRAPERPELVDDAHPYIHVDMARCIHCYRCERICSEVQGQDTWRVFGRGLSTRLVPDSGTTLRDSSCVSCGACSDSCPSGALVDKSRLSRGPSTRFTRTTCPYCGVGCEMHVGVRDGRIVEVKPALDAPVSRGHLCGKGRYAFDFISSPDRLKSPLVRVGDGFREVSWDEAVRHVSRRLSEIIARRGPDSVGVLGSARGTNEEAYVAQKFARVAIGTNNVDCCARVCHAPSAAALKTMFGAGAATSSFADIERARTILVCGSNTTHCHPVVGARIRQAARRGAHLVVVDSRRTELADEATIHLAPRPGTDLALFHAMSRVVLDEGLSDETFIAARVEGLEAHRAFLSDYDPENVAATCDVDVDAVRRAARLVARERPAISFHGLGLTEHVHGTDTVIALIDLALLTGNVGKPGTGVNPLRGQNNVQGTAHMGCEPRGLPGAVPIETGRAAFERAWGTELPRTRGLDLLEMMEAALDGRFGALWAVGYDVALTNPESARTRKALAALELVVVQDLFMTETARDFAHVVLPAAASFEKDGTFMNAERRIQAVRKVLDPPGEARPDSLVFCDVARALGKGEGFSFASAEAIWEEIRTVWPAGAGITYSRLERGGLQWPCPNETHPGTSRLHVDSFANGTRAHLRGVVPRTSDEVATESYPFVLITGRHLHQFNAGTMTSRTPHQELRPRDLLEVSPTDAASLGINDGDTVLVESRHGEARIAATVLDTVRQGELFATFHTAEVFLNRVLGTALDPRTHTPEFKRTAVRVRSISPK